MVAISCGEKHKKHMTEIEERNVQNTAAPMTNAEKKEVMDMVKGELKEEIAAMALLKRANNKRYGNLLIGLKNSYFL